MPITKPKSEQIRHDIFLIENTFESLGWTAKVKEVHEQPYWTQAVLTVLPKPKHLLLKKITESINKSLHARKGHISVRQKNSTETEVIIDNERYISYPLNISTLDRAISAIALIMIIISYLGKTIIKKLFRL